MYHQTALIRLQAIDSSGTIQYDNTVKGSRSSVSHEHNSILVVDYG
jgi:hypothetical protein